MNVKSCVRSNTCPGRKSSAQCVYFLTVKSRSRPLERRIPERAATPILESHEPLHSRCETRVGRKQEKKKRKKLAELLPVTRRGVFGRCHASSAQNRPPVRIDRTERKAGWEEEARENAQPRPASSSVVRYLAGSKIAIAPRPPSACCCFFLGAPPATTRIHDTLRGRTSCSFPPRRRQSSSLLYPGTI